jgi:hypothetical protein
VQVPNRQLSLERLRSFEEDSVALTQPRKVRFDLGLRDAGGSAIFLPYARDRKLEDMLYAGQPHDGLYWRCRIDERQCPTRVLFGKPSPQLDGRQTAEDVRRMTRMDANQQIARKFGYRVHSQPFTESTVLNQHTGSSPRRIYGLFNFTMVGSSGVVSGSDAHEIRH